MRGFSKKSKLKRCLVIFLGSIVLFVAYMHIYTGVFGKDLPRTAILLRRNADLQSRARYLDKQAREYADRLSMLEIRDENIYRPIFGLASIPDAARGAGAEGRRGQLSSDVRHASVRDLVSNTDTLMHRMYMQTRSYDEIELMLRTADNMSLSIPSISPVILGDGTFRITSPFGNRVHPIYGRRVFHKGIDFGGHTGNPVFASGDGVVETISMERRGYGRQVVINHGFGYKTRYAHLKTILVTEGMKVKRGDCIAVSGNTGKSTGPHLHYEVLYLNKPVNPYHYFDISITPEQYKQLVTMPEDYSGVHIHPSHKKLLK